MSSSEIIVHDDPDRHRYVALIDDRLAGFAVYHVRGGRYVFVHTEVDEAFGGQGVASMLARAALDDVRSRGALVVPLCPFIAGWIDRHSDSADLVDGEALERLGPADDRP